MKCNIHLFSRDYLSRLQASPGYRPVPRPLGRWQVTRLLIAGPLLLSPVSLAAATGTRQPLSLWYTSESRNCTSLTAGGCNYTRFISAQTLIDTINLAYNASSMSSSSALADNQVPPNLCSAAVPIYLRWLLDFS